MSTQDTASRARTLLDKLGETRWHPDHDWRDDGADQVLDGDDKTVCFLATGMNHDRHYARCVFIAATPELVHDLLAENARLREALRHLRNDIRGALDDADAALAGEETPDQEPT